MSSGRGTSDERWRRVSHHVERKPCSRTVRCTARRVRPQRCRALQVCMYTLSIDGGGGGKEREREEAGPSRVVALAREREKSVRAVNISLYRAAGKTRPPRTSIASAVSIIVDGEHVPHVRGAARPILLPDRWREFLSSSLTSIKKDNWIRRIKKVNSVKTGVYSNLAKIPSRFPDFSGTFSRNSPENFILFKRISLGSFRSF